MQPDTIIILGAGYTGKELTRLARHSDYRVVATSRDDETLEFLTQQGAIPVEWSHGDDPGGWAEYLSASTAVVYSIPTLFRRYRRPDDDALARHVEPLHEVVELCERRGAHRFIYLSSTSVYGDCDGRWVDETAELLPTSPVGKMRADIERHLLDQHTEFPINITRLVGIYGPNRSLIDYIQTGRYTLIDDTKQVTNRIHVHDIARGLIALSERGPDEHRVFNFSDGHPQPPRHLVEFICEQTDLQFPDVESLQEYARRRDDPNAVARRKNTVRVLNDRLREELDFSLVYPNAFTGYQAILDGEKHSKEADRDSAR